MASAITEDPFRGKKCPQCGRSGNFCTEMEHPAMGSAIWKIIIQCGNCDWRWHGPHFELEDAIRSASTILNMSSGTTTTPCPQCLGGSRAVNIYSLWGNRCPICNGSGRIPTCTLHGKVVCPECAPPTRNQGDDMTAGPPTPRRIMGGAIPPSARPPIYSSPSLVEVLNWSASSISSALGLGPSSQDSPNPPMDNDSSVPTYHCQYCKDTKIIKTKRGDDVVCPACSEEKEHRTEEGPSRANRNVNL